MYGMLANIMYMILMYASYEVYDIDVCKTWSSLKIHYNNIFYIMHIDKMQNLSFIVVALHVSIHLIL